jgi:phosphate-selective porin OprO/OprP
MRINRLASVTIIAATSFSAVAIGEARAQSAANNEAEIALLKQQLRLMEQKLDKLQKQTAANSAAAAKANEKADAKVSVANARS